MRRNSIKPVIAISEIKDYRWLRKGKILGMDEAFPDEIQQIRQEADDSNVDYAIGSNVESDGGDNFQDTICYELQYQDFQ